MIDVFLCSCARDPLRVSIFCAVSQRWHGYHVRKITSDSHVGFMASHRRDAERMANTDTYCVADDDCMPLGNGFIERAEAAMRARPDYGLVAFTDHLYAKYWAKSPEYGEDPDVWPVLSAGGIYLLRRGIVEYPDADWIDDVWVCDHIRAKGHKIGRFKKLLFNHYGYLLSCTYPERTGVTQPVDPQ